MQKLLIVDDDPSIREIFSILLTKHGYEVTAASGGEECLDHLTRMTPDFVLLDIMMHPVDGWETLTAIRKNPATSVIPTIMFSGKSPSPAEIFNYGGWIEDYFMKPIGMKTITGSLNSAFERNRGNQKEREQYQQNGADPFMVDEYFSLKRFLFIHDKFSRELFGSPGGPGQAVTSRKARYDELRHALSIGIPQKSLTDQNGVS
jgi:DNA-binding response OmpR family regulator